MYPNIIGFGMYRESSNVLTEAKRKNSHGSGVSPASGHRTKVEVGVEWYAENALRKLHG